MFADPIRHDRVDVNKSRGGGSLIYYKLGLQCTPLPQLEAMFSPNIDSTWVKIKTNCKPIIVGTLYKPPDASNAQLLQSLENLLLHQTVNQCAVIIAGDYNIDWNKKSVTKTNLDKILQNFDLRQLITGTTHVGLRNESCIDLILTSNSLRSHNSEIIFNPLHNGITWHNFTYISVNIRPAAVPRKIIYKRNFKRFNADKFLQDASKIKQFSEYNYEATTNEIANQLEANINMLVNKHAPFKRIRVRPTRKPWITKELLDMIYQRNKLFKKSINTSLPNQWNTYKEYRNHVKLHIRIAKETYYHNLIHDSQPNDRWKVIRQLTNNVTRTNDII